MASDGHARKVSQHVTATHKRKVKASVRYAVPVAKLSDKSQQYKEMYNYDNK